MLVIVVVACERVSQTSNRISHTIYKMFSVKNQSKMPVNAGIYEKRKNTHREHRAKRKQKM